MPKALKTTFKIFAIAFFVFLTITLGFLIFFGVKISKYTKTLTLDSAVLFSAYTKPTFLDSNENEMKFSNTKNTISLSELSDDTKNAFISIEDKNFYYHDGLNYKRMIGAALKNLTSGKFKQGASTISQQLVKNAFLTNEKTIDRKLKEIVLTRKLEDKYSKDEIFEIYLNTIYFGNNIFGIENTAETYFNKSASELSLSESAVLAGMVKAPNYYVNNITELTNRRNLVLREMEKDKKITKENKETAKAEQVNLLSIKTTENSALEQAITSEALSLLNTSKEELFQNKYTIYSSIDTKNQDILKTAISNQNSNAQIKNGGIIINNNASEISAFIGNVNNLHLIQRQTGSIIKPLLVYAPALELNVIAPETQILDEPINYSGYSPTNVNGTYSGYVSARKALEKSLNIPAVKILDYTGIDKAKNIASKMGLTFSDKDNNLSIALGSNSANLINLAKGYLVLANKGMASTPHFIRKIHDFNGKIVYEYKPKTEEVLRSDTAYLTTSMLKNAVKTGTAKELASFNFDIASKTGTVGINNSKNNTDAYNFTYTTDNVFGIWFGCNDKTKPLDSTINGATLPTRAVKEVVSKITAEKKPADFEKPQTILTVNLDAIELDNNHKLVFANSFTPERYIIETEASVYNLPKEISTNFMEVSAPSFSANFNEAENQIEIKFNANSTIDYEIYKNNELFQTVENEAGDIVLKDKNYKFNTNYLYSIKAKQTSAETQQTIESKNTEEHLVFIPLTVTEANKEQIVTTDNATQSQYYNNQPAKKPKKKFGDFFKFFKFLKF